MAKTKEEVVKALEETLAEMKAAKAEAKAAKAEADAARIELAALKGKKVDEGEESSKAVVAKPAILGRTRGPINYPKLTRTNYTLWAMQMRVALQAVGVWAAVHSEDVDFEIDRDALLAIYQGVPEDMLASLAGKDTAKAAWDAIKAVHVGHDRVRETNLQTLRKAFEALEMGDAESVDVFASRLNKLVSSIRALGDDMKELTVVQKILQAAPARMMHIVSALEQCLDLKTLTIEDVLGRFKAHEERVRMRFGDPIDGQHLMLTKKQWESFAGKKKSVGESPGGGVKGSNVQSGSHEKAEDKSSSSKPEEKPKKKKKFKCYNCGGKGYFAKDCSLPKKEKGEKDMLVEKQEDDHALLLSETCNMKHVSEVVTGKVFLNEQKVFPKLGDDKRCETNMWYLDTGASNHMSGARELFTELDKSIIGSVKFGDGSLVQIAGRGTVLITARDGSHRGLTDVYFIPKLKSNIVSLGQLEEHGCRILLEGGFLRIFDQQKKLLIKVPRGKNRLYTFNLHVGQPVCLLGSITEIVWLWHARYGHLNFDALRSFAQHSMVDGLPLVKHFDKVCDGCLTGKQRRSPFPKKFLYTRNAWS